MIEEVEDNTVLVDRPPKGMTKEQIEAQRKLITDFEALKTVMDHAKKIEPKPPTPPATTS